MAKRPIINEDTALAVAVAKMLINGRDPVNDNSVLITLDHVIALILIVAMKKDARKAAYLLNEGVVPAVEQRLSFYNHTLRRDKNGGPSNV